MAKPKKPVPAPPPAKSWFQPREIYAAYPSLNAVRMNQWRRIDPHRFEPRDKSKWERTYPAREGASGTDGAFVGEHTRSGFGLYSEDQLPDLAVLNRCYQRGLSPDQTREMLDKPDLLRDRIPGVTDLTFGIIEDGVSDEQGLIRRALRACVKALHCRNVYLFERRQFRPADPVAWHFMSAESHTPYDSPPDSRETQVAFLHRHMNGELSGQKTINLWGSALKAEFGGMPALTSALAHAVCLKGNVPRFCLFAEGKFAEDKSTKGGGSSPSCIFDPVDEAILEWAGRLLAKLWPTTVIHGLWRAGKAAESAEDLTEILRKALKAAVEATGAYRGEIFGKVPSEGKSVFGVVVAEGPSSAEGQPVEGRSICRLVYQKREPYYAPDTDRDPYYQVMNDRTRSQLALPINSTHAKEIYGVLSLEADQPNGFNEQDQMIGEFCAKVISQFTHFVAARDAIVGRLVSNPNYSDTQNKSDAFGSLIQEICSEFRFDQGLLFLPDHTHGTLRVIQSRTAIGYTLPPFSLSTPALATKVFTEGAGYFSADPYGDMHVDQKALGLLRVSGPILGVPLQFGDLTIGVVTLWDHRPASGSEPEDPREMKMLWESEMRAVEDFARSYLDGSRMQWETRVASALSTCRTELFHSNDLKSTVGAVLKATRAVFDRSRVCEVASANSFTVIGSSGSGPDGEEAENFYAGVRISDCEHVVFGDDGHERLNAVLFDPRTSDTFSDPNAIPLGKPPDLPYANGALWVRQESGLKLIGYVGVDNKATRRRITHLELDALDNITALAAPFLARFLGKGAS